jgi:hypothetical protein
MLPILFETSESIEKASLLVVQFNTWKHYRDNYRRRQEQGSEFMSRSTEQRTPLKPFMYNSKIICECRQIGTFFIPPHSASRQQCSASLPYCESCLLVLFPRPETVAISCWRLRRARPQRRFLYNRIESGCMSFSCPTHVL